MKKVLVYVVRAGATGLELLVFDQRHAPEAGAQVPAGTVDGGETYAFAAVRELHEESGLTGLTLSGPIDQYDWLNPETNNLHRRQVFYVFASGLPDHWDHTVHGGGDDAGWVFVYRWIPLKSAEKLLAGHQGRSVGKIPVETTASV